MTSASTAIFHKLYGSQKPRVVYYKRDFIDYCVMIALSAVVVATTYGVGRLISIVGLILCAFMLAMFMIRHGVEFRVPVILRRPQEVLYMILYKCQNLKTAYFIALGVLLLENMLIIATPTLPHHVDLMRKVAFCLFYGHLVLITLFRTIILADHIVKRELVREVLMQTPWRRVIKENTNITMEILHAYCTGLLTHIILIAPWYLAITYLRFSVIFLPVGCLLNILVYQQWTKVINEWFYRDHWLGHNSEFEFIYLHGTHHDAIPSGLIAVGENGLLEGVARYTIGSPVAFYNPVIAFLIYTYEVKKDIEGHQYVPGVFPRLTRKELQVYQHSTHHYGPLEPYSFAFKVDQSSMSEVDKKSLRGIPAVLRNSIRLDEELTDFRWDNPTYRNVLSLYDKYER
jgi:hypothetical protein